MAALDVLNKDVSLSFLKLEFLQCVQENTKTGVLEEPVVCLKLEFLQCIRENTKTGVFRGASSLPINRASRSTIRSDD